LRAAELSLISLGISLVHEADHTLARAGCKRSVKLSRRVQVDRGLWARGHAASRLCLPYGITASPSSPRANG
jgi:hypothetical protein